MANDTHAPIDTQGSPDERYQCLYDEIRGLLPADKKTLMGQLDSAVGERLLASSPEGKLITALSEIGALAERALR